MVETYPPYPKKLYTFPGTMRSYTVKENHIGSAVSVILGTDNKNNGKSILNYKG